MRTLVYLRPGRRGLVGMQDGKVVFPARGSNLRAGWAVVKIVADKGRYAFVRGHNFTPEPVTENGVTACKAVSAVFFDDGTVLADIPDQYNLNTVGCFLVKHRGEVYQLTVEDYAVSTKYVHVFQAEDGTVYINHEAVPARVTKEYYKEVDLHV